MSKGTVNKEIRNNYRELLRLTYPIAKSKDLINLRKAYEWVLEYHREDWEKSGRYTVYHSIEVAKIVNKEINLGITSIICALLHNMVSDDKFNISDLRKKFGDEVAIIIDGYIRLNSIETNKISLHSDNFRKLYLSIVQDIRVILIKLGHRLYDIRNLDYLGDKRRKELFQEIRHLYIPIAHRLGLYTIKLEMEDCWLKNTHPEVYSEIAKKIRDSKTKQLAYINDFIKPIESALFKSKINFTIKKRAKSIHSIWKKMKEKNVSFEEVFDLFAVRIIIDTTHKKEKADCWRVYSLVTDIYAPNPSRLRDWISSPKASGYESLHTTVKGTADRWVEVQIRTNRMDEIAEKGLASHWRYKEGGSKKDQEKWMLDIREVLENVDSKEDAVFDQFTGISAYSDHIFVFTPEGDLKKLPAGSTVLDFAYEIHTSVGDMCNGARINNKIVPIRHQLKSGDKVEIITSKNQTPKYDWLQFVVTNKAKSKIKRALNEEKFKEAELGKEILKRKLRNKKIQFSDTIVDKLLKQYKVSSSVDLYYLIALEKIDLKNIRSALEEKQDDQQMDDTPKAKNGQMSGDRPTDLLLIDEKNVHDLDFELAKCCNPVSGDAVFGFITVGKGITIHRINCPNAAQLLNKYDYRVIDVQWKQTDPKKKFLTTINIIADDTMGMLRNITDVISNDLKVNMLSVNVDAEDDGTFVGQFKVAISDAKHIQHLIKRLEAIKGVRKASRVIHPN